MTTPWEALAVAEARYDGEVISQLDHGLQAGARALAEGASDALAVAALLHDVGHLPGPDPDLAAADGRDLDHEAIGARWLARWFGPEVVEPVRLHVAAKRLLARDPAYLESLSPASRRSLAVQGGPFTDDEAAAFRAGPFAEDALRLRRWDDLAKDPDAHPPGLEAWADRLARVRR